MNGHWKNRWPGQFAVLAVALLLGNIAGLSCAVAAALCDDCPRHQSAACLDSCTTAQAVINDNTADRAVEFPTPVIANIVALAPVHSREVATHRIRACDTALHDPPPPLNLLYCVFLK